MPARRCVTSTIGSAPNAATGRRTTDSAAVANDAAVSSSTRAGTASTACSSSERFAGPRPRVAPSRHARRVLRSKTATGTPRTLHDVFAAAVIA